jgi:serine/threonine protein kinase
MLTDLSCRCQLFSYFEDSNFVYIIMELCRRRSLMELHKRRKAITEPETRYFMNQVRTDFLKKGLLRTFKILPS